MDCHGPAGLAMTNLGGHFPNVYPKCIAVHIMTQSSVTPTPFGFV